MRKIVLIGATNVEVGIIKKMFGEGEVEFITEGGVTDIHGKSISVGDHIRWNIMHWHDHDSGDLYGTEPQVSFRVVEAYIEQIVNEVVLYRGALCVQSGKEFLSLKEVYETQCAMFDQFCEWQTEIELQSFLESLEFPSDMTKEKQIERIKEMFGEFEIVSV